MTRHTWRDRAAPIIARVIAKVGRDDKRALRRALRQAYPFGQRANYPYKIWCDEVRRQIAGGPVSRLRRRDRSPAPGQRSLFEDPQP